MANLLKRDWWFIAYPESCFEDWRSRLDGLHIRALVSPLHSPDKETKKDHYHVIFRFSGKKSYDQVLDLAQTAFGSVNIVKAIDDIYPASRYLCHLDHPDRVRYSPSDVLCFGGEDYLNLVLNDSDNNRIAMEIKAFIFTHDIRYYSTLSDYADFVNTSWRNHVNSHSFFWMSYIKSRSDKMVKNIEENVDKLIKEFMFDESVDCRSPEE